MKYTTEKPSIPDKARKSLSFPAHTLSCDQVIRELEANPQYGLKSSDAASRLLEYGRNELDVRRSVQPFRILLRQISNAMMMVLIIAMVVSFSIQSWIEGGVISAIILLNIVVGYKQESSASKGLDSLRALSSPTATVIRDGVTGVIPNAELVPGDAVELKTGDTIPADVRLIEAVNFETDEALLTGESLPVQKKSKMTFDANTGPGDRLNIAYSSSIVTKGRATGVVFATGMNTEIGSIALALRDKKSWMRLAKHHPHGLLSPYSHVEAWMLTFTDAVGHFLGVNFGTPLQRKLSRLAVLLFGVTLLCAIIVEASNKFSGSKEVIIYAVATGLSMIPASLSAVLIITMAVGTQRMVQRNVIVRKLDSLEALGAITNICTDKTGTLTQGKMVVKKAWIPAKGTYSIGPSHDPYDPTTGDISHSPSPPSSDTDPRTEATPAPPSTISEPQDSEKQSALRVENFLSNNPYLQDFLNVASMANLAHVYQGDDSSWYARGDPTEIAIQVFASRFGWNRMTWTTGDCPTWLQIAEFPFDSNIKMMSVIYSKLVSMTETAEIGFKHHKVFTKGAVERVIESCTAMVCEEGGSRIQITEEWKREILRNTEALAASGHRVLALADREWHSPQENYPEKMRAEIESDLNFLGLISLYDPPRPESPNAVIKCHRAGISVHMLTGDHRSTAEAIAREVGILPSIAELQLVSAEVKNSLVMTAKEFDLLSDEELDFLPALPLVIARCTPTTKVRMIEALHRRKCFDAMTGDGVNDAPSLKRADIGIAMGSGSDVAKDASDIVLTDNNFASILAAIEEGRRMFDNVQKFVLHLLAENIAQASTLLVGLAFKDSTGISVFPLAPVEILWVIMITSGMPDMGLGMEMAAADIMERKPQDPKHGIFTLEILIDMLAYGIWMASLCLLSFILIVWGFGNGNLGLNCNETYSASCDLIFRARATTFVCMTWFALILAWEMVDMRHSFFAPGWMKRVYRNKFLFWAIIAGFFTIFPTLYVPVINHDVFKHEGISWEWGVVFVEALAFVLGVEGWKWCKRIWFRWQDRKEMRNAENELRMFVEHLELPYSSPV